MNKYVKENLKTSLISLLFYGGFSALGYFTTLTGLAGFIMGVPTLLIFITATILMIAVSNRNQHLRDYSKVFRKAIIEVVEKVEQTPRLNLLITLLTNTIVFAILFMVGYPFLAFCVGSIIIYSIYFRFRINDWAKQYEEIKREEINEIT